MSQCVLFVWWCVTSIVTVYVTGCVVYVVVCNQHCHCMSQGVFCLLLCPWTFFNVQRTKILQVITTVTRNIGMFKVTENDANFQNEGDFLNVTMYSTCCIG